MRGTGYKPVTLLLFALLPACLSSSAERAERDKSIGRATAPDIEVAVDEGLAAVRAITSNNIELWSQAPAIALALTSTDAATTSVTLTLRNIMPGSVLAATDPAGAPVNVGATAWLRPTAARWQIPLVAGQRLRLWVAPPDAGTREPYRFAVLSDVQEALSRVGDIYRRMNLDPSLRFVFNAGDLTADGTADELLEFQTRL
ncbi:MAG TPA: metallophosphoesterase, partial [Polyangia bacterium]